ncbi:MAG TPA: S8 family peptidase, partial [Bryobacteraceae bacterium]|nr:S8 family peptidase [Bryobacteraceae bacterium]
MKSIVRAVLVMVGSGLAFAGSKVSADLARSTSSDPVEVIVQFKTHPAGDTMRRVSSFGKVRRRYKSIPAVHMVVPASMIETIASNPQVAYVSPNRTTTNFLDITTRSVNANWFWPAGLDGTGVGVAVIDSGVSNKLDLWTADRSHSRVVYSQSFVPGLGATDQYGHGTHVAGIVGANGASSTGPDFSRTFKGVAPNANIINLRVLDANGSGRESEVIAAIDQAIALKNTYNIRVINLSLGHPVFESFNLDPLCQAVEAAWKAGITVVVAAGNMGRDNSLGTDGYATITSPGNDPYVITVGAMNANYTAWRGDDKIASYSSKGPSAVDHIVKPDIVAPGNGVVSLLASPDCTLATKYPDTLISNASYESNATMGNSGDYLKLSGTSMATPVVSAAVALLLQKDPALTPDQVKARLMKTAAKQLPRYTTSSDMLTSTVYRSQEDIFTVGAGYLDIQAAMSNTDRADFQALSPAAVYHADTKTITLVSGLSVVWGDSVAWGESVVWGDGVVWGDSVVWG